MSKYSDFWFDNRRTSLVDDLLSDVDKPVKKGKDHIALAGHKRAIGNFVRIVVVKMFLSSSPLVEIVILMVSLLLSELILTRRTLTMLLDLLFTRVVTLSIQILKHLLMFVEWIPLEVSS